MLAAIEESKEFWQNQIDRLKASRLPRSQYCRDNNINYYLGSITLLTKNTPTEIKEFIKFMRK